MKKRWIKRIAIIIASLLILFLVAGYFVMDYATNKILRAISIEDVVPNEQVPNLPSETSNVIATETPNSLNESQTPKTTSNPKDSITSQPAISPKPKYDASISVDKATKVKKNISFKDQSKISLILAKKLSSNEISLFSKMASGGLTIEEKREAKKIILQKLSEDEYNELIQIAAKLGLSQGQNYQDSIKSISSK